VPGTGQGGPCPALRILAPVGQVPGTKMNSPTVSLQRRAKTIKPGKTRLPERAADKFLLCQPGFTGPDFANPAFATPGWQNQTSSWKL